MRWFPKSIAASLFTLFAFLFSASASPASAQTMTLYVAGQTLAVSAADWATPPNGLAAEVSFPVAQLTVGQLLALSEQVNQEQAEVLFNTYTPSGQNIDIETVIFENATVIFTPSGNGGVVTVYAVGIHSESTTQPASSSSGGSRGSRGSGGSGGSGAPPNGGRLAPVSAG